MFANSSDGRVMRASASEAVDLGLIPSRGALVKFELGGPCSVLNI